MKTLEERIEELEKTVGEFDAWIAYMRQLLGCGERRNSDDTDENTKM
jgi:hypothetical protein